MTLKKTDQSYAINYTAIDINGQSNGLTYQDALPKIMWHNIYLFKLFYFYNLTIKLINQMLESFLEEQSNLFIETNQIQVAIIIF